MSDAVEIKWATPAQVMAWMQAGEAVVVDVRETHEFASGHLPGAQNLPLSSFDPATVPQAEGKKLVIHCQSGVRCGHASQILAGAGRKGTIHRMQGGIASYARDGGPIER
jgi:rhodanese-related sulfurtransferase